MKNEYTIPNALALTTVIVFILCLILVGLFPDISFTIARSWFHGIELGKSSSLDLATSSFVLGLISSAITAWVIGYIFVKVQSLLSK